VTSLDNIIRPRESNKRKKLRKARREGRKEGERKSNEGAKEERCGFQKSRFVTDMEVKRIAINLENIMLSERVRHLRPHTM
jgi:hypothetical protein